MNTSATSLKEVKPKWNDRRKKEIWKKEIILERRH